MDIHIIKKITKFILKPPMKRNLKTRKTINNQMGLRKKFNRPTLAFGGFLWGWASKGGGGSAQGTLHLGLSVSLCSVCFHSHRDQSGLEPPRPFPKEPTTLQAGPASQAGWPRPHQVPIRSPSGTMPFARSDTKFIYEFDETPTTMPYALYLKTSPTE